MSKRLEALLSRYPCFCGCGQFPKGPRSRFRPGHDERLDSRLDDAIAEGDLEAIQVKRAVHDWNLPNAEVWRICREWHARRRGTASEPDDASQAAD
jgi:hypothetical protein